MAQTCPQRGRSLKSARAVFSYSATTVNKRPLQETQRLCAATLQVQTRDEMKSDKKHLGKGHPGCHMQLKPCVTPGKELLLF